VKPNLNAAVVIITANISLSGNLTKSVTGPTIRDFVILKAFNINTHHPNVPKIIEVFWHPPIQNWVKCNTDGASIGNPGVAACAGIFRNRHVESKGCFAANIGIANALYAELMGVILAIEIAYHKIGTDFGLNQILN